MGVEDIISRNRLKSKVDPGIYGIVYRMCLLEFVDKVTRHRSGQVHGKDSEWLKRNGYDVALENLKEDGIIEIHYRLDTQQNQDRAKQFHKDFSAAKFREKQKDARYNIYVGVDAAGVDLRLRDWGRGYIDEENKVVAVKYDIVVDAQGESVTKSETLNALCEFWQQISDFMTEYEQTPTIEEIKPMYFTLRGKGSRLYLPK
jgi:hypothetical protein